MARGNLENLIKNSELTPQERKEKAKKAGQRSGVVRKEKKMIQAALRKALSGKYEIDDKQIDGYLAIAIKMVKEAIGGNVQAFKEIRDTIGEKPKDIVGLENENLTEIKIKFVDKSNIGLRKDVDPRIVGDYTPPSNTTEE